MSGYRGEGDDDAAQSRRWRADRSAEGRRLDRWLASILGVSRRRVSRWIQEGRVLVGGVPAAKGRTLRVGDEVEALGAPDPVDFDPVPDSSEPVVVRFEHRHLVVVDKPPGQPSHPLRGEERGTLAQGLLSRYPEMRGVGYRRREPGLLHRLDVGTSGLVMAARSAEAFSALRAELHGGRFRKSYLALVVGAPPVGASYESLLESVPGRSARVRIAAAGTSRPVRTRVVAVDPIGADWSLVEVEAARAARHQIRVHLASAGHPLAGDVLYGGPAVAGLSHHFLHASALGFEFDGCRIEVQAPLPAKRSAVLRSLASGDP